MGEGHYSKWEMLRIPLAGYFMIFGLSSKWPIYFLWRQQENQPGGVRVRPHSRLVDEQTSRLQPSATHRSDRIRHVARHPAHHPAQSAGFTASLQRSVLSRHCHVSAGQSTRGSEQQQRPWRRKLSTGGGADAGDGSVAHATGERF